MALNNVRILITKALEDLSQEDLSRFRTLLREPRGDGLQPQRFRLSRVEGRSGKELADLLVDTFVEKAVEVSVALLRAIHCHHVANELEGTDPSSLRWVRHQTPRPPPAAKSVVLVNGADLQKHFVDRHHLELIERVSNVSSILDYLLQKEVLQQEQYDRAVELRSMKEQMRFLFSGPLRTGGDHSRDVLMSALCIQEPHLVQDLWTKEGQG